MPLAVCGIKFTVLKYIRNTYILICMFCLHFKDFFKLKVLILSVVQDVKKDCYVRCQVKGYYNAYYE